MSDAIDAAEASHIPRDVIRQLVFKCNVFCFDGKIYEQIQGSYGNGDKDGSLLCKSVHGQI